MGLYKGQKELDFQLGESGHGTTEIEVIVGRHSASGHPRVSAYDPVVCGRSDTCGEVTLPSGLFGGHRRDFIIPAGVPKPKGPKAHCNFYYLQDNTFE